VDVCAASASMGWGRLAKNGKRL